MEFLEILKHLVAGKHARDDLMKITTAGLKYLDKAEAWLDDIEKNHDPEEISNIFNTTAKNARKNISDKIRSGEINQESLDKLHRLTLMFPSSQAIKDLEKTIRDFYDECRKQK